MTGHAKIVLAVISLLSVTGTLTQGVSGGIENDDMTERFGPLEVSKSDMESNRLNRKDTELEHAQGEAQRLETETVRVQGEEALAAVFGTRRRGSTRNESAAALPHTRGCVTEGAVFAEGSAMVSPDECSYCFCIRGKQRCVAPKCLLPVEGCRPRYRSFSCCPSYYDCHDASTTTTTTTKTPRDCVVNGERYFEGELVEGVGGLCENCYCFNGEVTCTETTCAPPLDGCKPVMQEGHCCPVKYDCDDGNRRVAVDEFFKDIPVKLSTVHQRRDFERMKPEWQTNMARKSPGGEAIITDLPDEQPTDELNAEAEQNDETIPEEPQPQDEEESQVNDGEPQAEAPHQRTKQRKRIIGRISRPSAADIANRRKQTRYPQRRPTPRIRQPQNQRRQSLSSRFKQRIKSAKDESQNEDRVEVVTSTSPSPSKSLTTTLLSSESTTKPVQTATHSIDGENGNYDSDNELNTTIKENVEQVTKAYNNNEAPSGPVPGISDATHESQTIQEKPDNTDIERTPTSTERTSIQKPTRFELRRPDPLRRRPQSQSLSFRFRQRLQKERERERAKTELQEETTSTTDRTTPAKSLLPSSSSTTTTTTSTTTTATTTTMTPTSESTVHSTQTTTAKTPLLEDYPTTIEEFDTTTQDTDFETSIYDDTTSKYNEQATPSISDIPLTQPDDTTSQYEEEQTTQRVFDLSLSQQDGINFEDTTSQEPSQWVDQESLQEETEPAAEAFTFPATTLTPVSLSTLSSTTTPSPTTTTTIFVTTFSHDESIPEVSRIGHGEAIPVHDISELREKPQPSLNLDETIKVGTGVNVKGNIDDAVAFGPILIFDNSVRTDRQNKDLNITENNLIGEEENTAATEVPEETTMLNAEDTDANNDTVVNDEALADYEAGTEEVTTLFPILPSVKETTLRLTSEQVSQTTPTTTTTITTTTTTTTESSDVVNETSPIPPGTEADFIPGDDFDYADIETGFPSYDITVGASVIAGNQPSPPAGKGEVIPVKLGPEHLDSAHLEMEHKTPEVGSGPDVNDEGPSLLGTILNILTRTEAPRPERFSPNPAPERFPLPPPPSGRIPPPPSNAHLPPPPPPLPFRPPFRPRPRPDGRPDRRPDFIPPRFRPPPPPPPPAHFAEERDTTEEPETIDTSPSPPIIIPTTVQTQPEALITTETGPVANQPVSGFIANKPLPNIPIHIQNQNEDFRRPTIANRPDFIPNLPIGIPPKANQPNNPAGLPSQPVIEGGFQAIRDNEGVDPVFDTLGFPAGEKPTLPPSLPNLQIIPFVAADAVVNQDNKDVIKLPTSLHDTGDDNSEDERTDSATEAPTTTTRRSLTRISAGLRRPPILPPRRTIIRNDEENSTRRPFRPPGERPPRPPFSHRFTTTTRAGLVDSEGDTTQKPFFNRKPSSRPPFIPPRRFTAPTPETSSPITITTTTTTTRPPQPATTTPTTTTTTTTTTTETPEPIESDDIANVLIQDVLGFTDSIKPAPIRFTPNRPNPKPIIPVKTPSALPEIPAAVRNQMPLATDPDLVSGLLKLSGCNIYGRMYAVGDNIKELTEGCKQCQCTPVGVQCLPVC